MREARGRERLQARGKERPRGQRERPRGQRERGRGYRREERRNRESNRGRGERLLGFSTFHLLHSVRTKPIPNRTGNFLEFYTRFNWFFSVLFFRGFFSRFNRLFGFFARP